MCSVCSVRVELVHNIHDWLTNIHRAYDFLTPVHKSEYFRARILGKV
jgi:hypothetical protein